jgi:hypothetical protein
MTDNGGMQRIGRNDADSPAGRDWREDLHGQRREDDRKKIPQPPPHRSIPPRSDHQLITRINECRDLGSGKVPRRRVCAGREPELFRNMESRAGRDGT